MILGLAMFSLLFSSVSSKLSNAALKINEASYCAVYSDHSSSLSHEYKIVFWHNSCVEQRLPTDGHPYAVLVETGYCSINQKIHAANNSHAHLLLIVLQSNDKILNIKWNMPIPVFFITASQGEILLKHFNSASSSATNMTFSKEDTYIVKDAEVILTIFAIITVVFGAIFANRYWDFLKIGVLEVGDSLWFANVVAQKEISTKVILVIALVVAEAATLVTIYFFYYPIIYIVLFIYTVGSFLSTFFVLSPFIAKLHFLNYRLQHQFKCFPVKIDLKLAISLFISSGLSMWWFINRNLPCMWFPHNVLSVFFIMYIIQSMMPTDAWMVTAFSVLMLFYDIFFVLITPVLTHGDSVMEAALEGKKQENSYLITAGSTSLEQLPVLFSCPRFFHYNTCDNTIVYLGFGDVAIPGIFIAQCLRFDIYNHKNLYFFLSTFGYTIGLITAFTLLNISSAAQPALMYVIPCSLMPVFVTLICKGQLKDFFFHKEDFTERTIIAL